MAARQSFSQPSFEGDRKLVAKDIYGEKRCGIHIALRFSYGKVPF
jgi:hypothetical protein